MLKKLEYYFLFIILFALMLLVNNSSVMGFLMNMELGLLLLLYFCCENKSKTEISFLMFVAIIMVCEACMGLSLVVGLTLKSSNLFSKLHWE